MTVLPYPIAGSPKFHSRMGQRSGGGTKLKLDWALSEGQVCNSLI